MPESVVYADNTGADVETYIQLYNAAGFLLQVEADWVQRIIQNAKKPVMTIKPLAAGRLLPIVGFSFVWNTIRDQDMVTIGTTTPAEARETIEISLDLLNRRLPQNELQKTRSKSSIGLAPKAILHLLEMSIRYGRHAGNAWRLCFIAFGDFVPTSEIPQFCG